MDARYEITTRTDDLGRIFQETDLVVDGVRETIMRTMMDTREAETKMALIRMGWTPPNDKAPP